MDRFHELNAFIAVVEAGGFSAAARRTGDSQSAISKAVGSLERIGLIWRSEWAWSTILIRLSGAWPALASCVSDPGATSSNAEYPRLPPNSFSTIACYMAA